MMHHRRGGKRIRMDDPVPPEYDAPMTPMNDPVADLNESYPSYTAYHHTPQTPVHNPT